MLMQKEIKKNCTYKMNNSTIQMLDEIKQATGISKSEILAQFIKSYYTSNNLYLQK